MKSHKLATSTLWSLYVSLKSILMRHDVEDRKQSWLSASPKTKTNIVRSLFVNSGRDLYFHRNHIQYFIREKFSTQSSFCGKRPLQNRLLPWIGLENAGEYTGHSFRSLKNLLADGCGDIINLKRHGGRKIPLKIELQ